MARWILVFCLFLLHGPSLAALEVPYLQHRVTDLAQLIDADAEARLTEQLRQLETDTGAQVAVLTIPSLQGEVLEDYSLRVVETWKLGREGVDDGVLVLVARDDRKVRIEVGYGLEGELTDLQSRRIVDGLMVPAFRQGDFAGGIEAAVRAVAGAVRGETRGVPVPVEPTPTGTSPFLEAAPVVLFIFFPFVGAALATPGRQGWVTWATLMPFFFLAGAVFFGIPGGLVLLAIWALGGGFLRLVWPKSWQMKPARRGRGITWVGGGSGGGGFRSSGGGFSGGGGSFGGGGASGSW